MLQIHEGLDRIDFETVHGWLVNAYWSEGIDRATVERAARNSSLVIGAYDGDTQVGYMRVVSDRARFAWIADVYVAETHRKRGIAKQMLRYALSHPEHQGLRRWVLATRDAHPIYAECGFVPLPEPGRWMMRPG
ncbi:GNAT family N-acetyltransferase [Fimbriimonas ginsengisoli]|uniref:Acetyltransferase n=1 Tax=Fimbriimonas ginsengisoli Gsoil 348 TaxID=661478 RepID=A0A068NUV4_FIMGI|nr:GNAT family N-acetyltransferase [Fimbriimonas ginsengisoli]AIE86535.1 acetyltransferase [Fimbriimonas ginsengisoli Gsoil 348]